MDVRVRHVRYGRMLIAPRIQPSRVSAASGELPFGFGRQATTGPRRVRGGVLPRDVHHRMAVAPRQTARRSFRMAPVGARSPAPPLPRVAQIDGTPGRTEQRRPGHEQLGRRAGKVVGVRNLFRHRDVAGRLHELGERRVGDLGGIHPEAIDADAVDGLSVARDARQFADGVGGGFAAHRELTAGNPDHARRRGRARDLRAGDGWLESSGHRRRISAGTGREQDGQTQEPQSRQSTQHVETGIRITTLGGQSHEIPCLHSCRRACGHGRQRRAGPASQRRPHLSRQPRLG